ncbi:hypothetical protein ES705_24517 [subsurface metagenome]
MVHPENELGVSWNNEMLEYWSIGMMGILGLYQNHFQPGRNRLPEQLTNNE